VIRPLIWRITRMVHDRAITIGGLSHRKSASIGENRRFDANLLEVLGAERHRAG
jgi:hypothetical protein